MTNDENEDFQAFLQQMRRESEFFSQQPETKEEDWKRVRLNISGKIFETYRRTLTRKKESIFNLENCQHYYDPVNNEYYFDRNPRAFEAIFTFMQCGILSQPPKVPGRFKSRELRSFAILFY